MKRYLFLLIGLSALSQIASAQLTSNVSEPEWQLQALESTEIPTMVLEVNELDEILKEDSIDAVLKRPKRFGIAIDSLIDLKTKGFFSVSNDLARYQLVIQSPKAYSINLNFNEFYLPSGSSFYIKSIDHKDQIGAITQKNNKENGQFSTRPIQGDAIKLDLYIPLDKIDSVRVQISQIIHAYRDFFFKSQKTFNSSGSCNVNTNCPEADLWQDIKRSVVLITASNNTRLCTGTLVNNVREDSTPYLLTAFHCNLSTNSIFVFGYENSSGNCRINADGSLANSISGAISRAENNYSDFKLFQLSSTPPPSYNAYYSGWDASGNAPFESTSIHHPNGDIKKFSQDYDTARSSRYAPPNNDTHWQVGNWELGTTEQGSSGAALFDQYKRVVGQLEGGSASCTRNLEDYYGKFSLSWDFNSMTNRQLKHWLDPDNTNTLVLDGMDPLAKANNNDVELSYVSNVPSFSCDTTILPTVHFMNVGNDSLQNVTILYGTNNQYNTSINWTGNIKTDEMSSQALGSVSLTSSDSVFNVKLQLIPSDQDSSNNTWSKNILVNPDPENVGFTINTDEYGNETTWEIKDSGSNQILHKGGPYDVAPDTSGLTYRDSLCLYEGCFDLTIYDAFGDGFSSPFYGYGYILITDKYGDTLLYEANFTTAQKTVSFCINDSTTSISEKKLNVDFLIYPNPIRKGELLKIKDPTSQYLTLELIDMNGRIILNGSGNELRIPTDLNRGMYILQIRNSAETIGREKILVE